MTDVHVSQLDALGGEDGPAGVLAGSARLAQEAQEEAASVVERDGAERKRRALERRTQRRQARIAAWQAELQAEQEELERIRDRQSAREDAVAKARTAMGVSRMADTTNDEPAAEAKGDEP
jgi:circadian clock protein KaiC